ncbi:hypothetical protein RR46_00597 [Papilio xuthus]|uniref:Uncharacterized protein n=1 Tax=Papilio xuthus TaxID=66420 RepID=A0A0N0PA88_PAPXU|nr:hypothetical protein RR46_00597 [Papilio xuthus]
MKIAIALLLLSCYLVSCFPPPHPAVVQVRLEEELLPEELRSPALRNPHLQEILPLTSVLHEGEKPVRVKLTANAYNFKVTKYIETLR